MVKKELQPIFDKLCEDFEKVKDSKSLGIFLRDYQVPEGMSFGDVFYQYISAQRIYNKFEYYILFDGVNRDGTRTILSCSTEQVKDVPADTFEFEDEE